MQTWITCSL